MPHLIELLPDEITARLVVTVIHRAVDTPPVHTCCECGARTGNAVVWVDGDEGQWVCRTCLRNHQIAWRVRDEWERGGE